MHELSLMEGVLTLVQEAQDRHGFRKVVRVVLEVGTLAGVETEALRFCWEAVTAGTVAEGAALEWATLPAWCPCGRCDREVEVQSRIDLCPICGGALGAPVCGVDLTLKSLEVE